ncbi:L-dopachrome tautomerase-related protein [Sphingomonas sp. I4]
MGAGSRCAGQREDSRRCPKLVRIDLASNTVTKTILVPGDVALQGTYLNDIRFSPDGKTGYITDSGTRGAIIVVDLESGKSHRALDGHPRRRSTRR